MSSRCFDAAENRASASGIGGASSAMFHEGVIADVVIRPLVQHSDQRGWLCELFRADEIPVANLPAMAYWSVTLPGVVRGPHEHAYQSDYFAFVGPGQFRVEMWDNRRDSPTFYAHQSLLAGADQRCSVIIPPGVVHAYKNIGNEPGWVFNAPNCLYAGEGRRDPVDEIRHEDDLTSPFLVE